MKAVVFGAGSAVGQQLVRLLLSRGDQVISVVRASEAYLLPPAGPLHTVVIGSDGISLKSISTSLEAVDVVFSTVTSKQPTERRKLLGLETIVSYMLDKGVQRLVVLSNQGILQANDTTLVMQLPGFASAFYMTNAEHLAAVDFLENIDNIDWTVVCPPNVFGGEPSGEYRVKENYLPVSDDQTEGQNPSQSSSVSPFLLPSSPSSSRIAFARAGDVAHFMIEEAASSQFRRKRVGIVSIR